MLSKIRNGINSWIDAITPFQLVSVLAIVGVLVYAAAGAQTAQVPVGQMCNSERNLLETQPDHFKTIMKTETLWKVLNTQENVVMTLIPAPEAVKPASEVGKMGWCVVQFDKVDNV